MASSTVVLCGLLSACFVFGTEIPDDLKRWVKEGKLVAPGRVTSTAGGLAREEGRRIILFCHAPNGFPRSEYPHTFEWYLNGVQLEKTDENIREYRNRRHYLEPATIGKDEGAYTCTYHLNDFDLGSWPSKESIIELKPKQAELDPAPRAYVEKGSNMSVTLTCSTPSVGTFVYCFAEDSMETRCLEPNSNTLTVYTESGEMGDGITPKYFRCQAKNRDRNGNFTLEGRFSEQVAVVSVDKPETPTISYSYIEDENGDMIQLVCHTNTSYVGEYEDDFRWAWKLDGAILTTGPDNVYNISKVEIDDLAGDYTCVASIGQVSSDESEIFMLC